MPRYLDETKTHSIQIGCSRGDGITKEARKLLAEGCNPFDRLEAYRGGMLCLYGVLWRLAGVIVSENTKSGPKFVRYRPFEVALGQKGGH